MAGDSVFCPAMIIIRTMSRDEATVVARLHAATITEGFLNKLGIRFLAGLYRGILEDGASQVWVADRDGEIIGFCAYTQDVGAMYRSVLRRRFLPLAFASLPYSLNPFVLKEVLDTYRYPDKQESQRLPAAEILSLAVDAGERGTGTGRRLLEEAIRQAARDGATEIKVVAGADLVAANRFYVACGFAQRAEIVQHGHTLNVYVGCVPPHEARAEATDRADRPG